jgi:hypothetical protein
MPLSGGRRPVAGTAEVARVALISARSMSRYLDRDAADAQFDNAQCFHRRGAPLGLVEEDHVLARDVGADAHPECRCESISMRRRLFTILSALSLLLFVAVCGTWVRSRFVEDHLTPRADYLIVSRAGTPPEPRQPTHDLPQLRPPP